MKRKVIKSYENLSPEVKNALTMKYPEGYEEEVTSIHDVIKGGFFKGMIFDQGDITYLIRFKNAAEIEGEKPEDMEEDSLGYDSENINEDYDD